MYSDSLSGKNNKPYLFLQSKRANKVQNNFVQNLQVATQQRHAVLDKANETGSIQKMYSDSLSRKNNKSNIF